jgi:prolyl 4-hydroxylase
MNYIKEKKYIIDPETCNNLINYFETNTSEHFKGYLGSMRRLDLSHKNSDEMYVAEDFSDKMALITQNIFLEYIKENIYLAGHFILEKFRIKRYVNDGKHMYNWHIDTSPSHHRRILTVIYYLNDVSQGGETVVKVGDDEIKVVPEIGKVLLFPANFCYPHCGLPPISNNKYILTTFVCYP